MLKFFAAIILGLDSLDFAHDDALCMPIVAAATRVLESDSRNVQDATIAQQVLELLALKTGADRLETLKAVVLRTITLTKRQQSNEAKQLAVTDPRAYAKRRLQRQQRKPIKRFRSS